MAAPYVGEIILVAFDFPPANYAFCEGQLLAINQFPALFSLLGTSFGGDGQVTFRLPDFRGRAPIHQGQGNGLTPYTIGEQAGTESVTLTLGQLPQHNHLMQCASAVGNSASPAKAVLAKSKTADKIARASAANTTLDPTTLSPAGNGAAHENRQPSLALRYCIALFGIFPAIN